MKKIITIAYFFALSLVSASANAAFQFADWNADGDKKALIDTSTGLEWLRLSNTHGKSMSAIANELATTYAGWRLPTNAEVTTAMMSLYNGANLQFTETTARGGTYGNGANRFADFFGAGSRNITHMRGLYRDEDGIIRFFGAYYNENGAYTITYALEYGASYCYTCAAGGNVGGVFLVSDGGTTLTSKNNPLLNVNNPDAPINQPPGGAVSLADLVVGTTYATATLDYVASGVSGMLGYKYRINGGAEQTSTSNVISLTGLSSGTNYVLEYAAYNDKGTGTWSSSSITTAVSSETPLIGLLGGVMLLALRRRQVK